jgi:hypothetical protein
MNPQNRRKEWRDSEAKKLLLRDLQDGVIHDNMPPQAVYHLQPEYQENEYEQFRDRLNDNRKNMKEKKIRSQVDFKAIQQDSQIHPTATHDQHGGPHWEGSEAQKLLQEDVKTGTDRTMTPLELWESKEAYKEHNKDVFRGHIYQECR